MTENGVTEVQSTTQGREGKRWCREAYLFSQGQTLLGTGLSLGTGRGGDKGDVGPLLAEACQEVGVVRPVLVRLLPPREYDQSVSLVPGSPDIFIEWEPNEEGARIDYSQHIWVPCP